MTTPAYPIILPVPNGFGASPGVQVQTTDGELGPIDVRRISRQPTGDAKLTFRFLGSEYKIFVDWWRDELLDGLKWFTMPIPSGGGFVDHVMRFSDRYTATKPGFDYFEVSVACEIRDRQF